MKTKRVKATSIPDRSEFELIVNHIATTSVDIRQMEARRDEALQRTRESYAIGLKPLIERQQLLSLAAEKYAKAHREELLPGKLKSAETALAIYGFRTGMPALKTLAKWTWKKVLACIVEREEGRFIRIPDPEVNKEALHAAHNNNEIVLSEIGCRVVQEETFFVEPKERQEVRP